MSDTSLHVLRKLVEEDRFVSGESIAQELGLSRMAISKAIKNLGNSGLEISSVQGKGYRLRTPVQLLAADRIQSGLSAKGKMIKRLEVFRDIESTSDHLLARAVSEDIDRHVCLAEHQVSGRGRRQRQWYSAAYRNVMLSVGWRFDDGMAGLSGLGIAAGIAVARVLHDAGLDREIGLKWPNDIVWRDRKLGGLLIDVRGEHDGPCQLVLGLGLNLSMTSTEQQRIDQPVATLEDVSQSAIDRNEMVCGLVHAIIDLLENYSAATFSHWQSSWDEHDRLYGREVQVTHARGVAIGRAMGIDEIGALVVHDANNRVTKYLSGDVSVRLHD